MEGRDPGVMSRYALSNLVSTALAAADDCLPSGPIIDTDITSGGGGAVMFGALAASVVGAVLVMTWRRRAGVAVATALVMVLGVVTLASTATSAYASTSQECVGQGSGLDQDTDGDGLPDVIEDRIGTAPNLADGDGDGLSDADEIRTITDPTKADSDGDGVRDGDEDTDQDGLTNRAEIDGVTSPSDDDSDNDGLGDGEEPKYGTDPVNPDTDGDGVSDRDEVTLGSDPLKAVKDQVYSWELENTELDASAVVKGSAAAVLSARLVPAQDQLGGVTGAIGMPVALVSDGDLASGTLTFHVDPELIPSGDVAVLHFNDDTGEFDRPAVQSVDRSTGTVTVTSDSFSPFVLVSLDQFTAVWKGELDLPREGTAKNIAAVLAIDSSGSMSSSDPDDLRKDAAKSFIDALASGDLAGGVDFDSYVVGTQPLTGDFEAVKDFIDTIDSSGGTDIGAAVDASLDELDRGASGDLARIIVLLTDGWGDYRPELTQRAVDSATTIYTVGLGDSVDDTLLQGIADSTGGTYFKIADAGGLVDAYRDISGDIGSPDTDGDGLSDKAETDGWRTQRGTVYKTDPSKTDTDGDGLTDGQESGAITTSSWGNAYVGLSDPTKKDTDGDGLDDPSEVLGVTSAWSSDTDGDGLGDLAEYDFDADPTQWNVDGDNYNDAQEYAKGLHPREYDLTGWEATGAFMAGFTFGEWEWGARNVGRQNDAQMQSFQYIGGQMVSGVLVFGDVRDAVSQLADGNWSGAGLSAIGLVPFVGDGAKVVSGVAKFATRGERAAKASYRYVYELPASQSLKRKMAASVFGDAATVLPKALQGGPANTFVYIGSRNGVRTYAGITSDVSRRQSEHLAGSGIRITPISAKLTRGEARAIEQALIARAGGPKTPGFLNQINSISPKHYYYDDAVEWGEAWLKAKNVVYP